MAKVSDAEMAMGEKSTRAGGGIATVGWIPFAVGLVVAAVLGFRAFMQEYGKLIAESREQSLDRMIAEARTLGANAIVAMRFTTSVMMGGAAELLAVGTAVIIEDEA